MDLKIFSYITKDNFDNQFRCSVFKAYRKVCTIQTNSPRLNAKCRLNVTFLTLCLCFSKHFFSVFPNIFSLFFQTFCLCFPNTFSLFFQTRFLCFSRHFVSVFSINTLSFFFFFVVCEQQSKALFIVRTIGQAFEVCHHLQQPPVDEKTEKEKTTVTPKGRIDVMWI